MKVNLSYDTDGLQVELPETPGFQGIWRPSEPPVLKDPAAAITESLQNPLQCQPLLELAKGRQSVCIVISDITRPVPNKIILPPLLATLQQAGIKKEDITILIATGIHRPNEGDELIALVGEEIAAEYRIINHFSKETDDMVLVGKIDGEVLALINRHYVAADLKILTGFIEPHMWAGFSGGRKSILPGISSIETLEYMHGPEMIAHPRTVYGALEDNPFHQAGLAIMAKAGADFIVNVTLNTDKEITRVFAGDPVEAHLQGCNFLAHFCIKEVEQPLDFIITTNAGAPLDCNLYQSVKGITGAAPVVRKGGEIVIASSCFEGLGSPEYIEILNMVDTPKAFIERLLNREFFIPDQWCAQETYQVMIDHPVWLYAQGVTPAEMERYHFQPVSDLKEAVEKLLVRYGSQARWAVVPDGPLLILRLAG